MTSGPTTWNSIDDEIKKAISTNHFGDLSNHY